ncbi:MAG: branched-chain amino acid ABC transporter permease [Thermodesulfobacteriota bacterium]|nr:branched-chain amino acid ABC transporter permease [Thermodesulfobacteriota bacterium]
MFILILLFACISQAWNVIGGYCGQVSFGHAVFFGIGAYGAGMAVVTYHISPWPGVLAGAVLAALVAMVISWPVFKLSGHYFAIATFALVEIFNRLFMVWYWVGGAPMSFKIIYRSELKCVPHDFAVFPVSIKLI